MYVRATQTWAPVSAVPSCITLVSATTKCGEAWKEMALMTTAHRLRQLLIAGLIVVCGALLAHRVQPAVSVLIVELLLAASSFAVRLLCGQRRRVPTAVENTCPTVAKRSPR
jgi:uncharacterized membrane protein